MVQFLCLDWSTFLSMPARAITTTGRKPIKKREFEWTKERERHQFEWCWFSRSIILLDKVGKKAELRCFTGAFGDEMMAMSPAISTSFLPNRPLSAFPPCQSRGKNFGGYGNFQKPISFTIRAAKLPPGVEVPKVEPKLTAPTLGFTQTAEIWNARVCMIGLVGIFIVELIFHKGILQIIGIDVGKGLDLPL